MTFAAEFLSEVKEVASGVDEDSLFVGHSVGCQTILRYLETLPQETKIGKVILIAPWLTLQHLDDDESPSTAKPWLETPVGFEKILDHTHDFTCFLSTNDPYVPLDFAKKLKDDIPNSELYVVLRSGHYVQEERGEDVRAALKEFIDK